MIKDGYFINYNLQVVLENNKKDGQEYLYTIIDHYRKEYNDVLKRSDPVSAAYSFQKEIDDTIKQKEPPKPISCKQGCSFCCNLHVDISEHEAMELIEVAKESCVKIDWDKLKRQSKFDDSSSWRQLSKEDQVCVFLKDNECSVYEHRPAACRRQLVTSAPERCDSALEYDGVVEIYNVIEAEVIYSAMLSEAGFGGMANLLLKHK